MTMIYRCVGAMLTFATVVSSTQAQVRRVRYPNADIAVRVQLDGGYVVPPDTETAQEAFVQPNGFLPPAVAERPLPEAKFAGLKDAEALKKLADELGSADYATRQQATLRLLASGEAAVPTLHAATKSADAEVSTRALKILETLLLRREELASLAADAVLSQLAETPLPVDAGSDRSPQNTTQARLEAERVLNLNHELREARAIPEIQKRGGIVKFADPRTGQLIDSQVRGAPPVMVVLNRKWKSDDAGIQQLMRLPRLRTLYVVRNTLTEQDVAKLEAKMPNLSVQTRGAACLGVSGAAHPLGCQIQRVSPDSAASEGGLRAFDVITKFGDKPATDFEALVELIAEHDPGDTVKVKIIRRGQPDELTITLQEWK